MLPSPCAEAQVRHDDERLFAKVRDLRAQRRTIGIAQHVHWNLIGDRPIRHIAPLASQSVARRWCGLCDQHVKTHLRRQNALPG
jgi:hypothetical protein